MHEHLCNAHTCSIIHIYYILALIVPAVNALAWDMAMGMSTKWDQKVAQVLCVTAEHQVTGMHTSYVTTHHVHPPSTQHDPQQWPKQLEACSQQDCSIKAASSYLVSTPSFCPCVRGLACQSPIAVDSQGCFPVAEIALSGTAKALGLCKQSP